MNLRHLEFFIELAKAEHMAKTAETLCISQPSLSYVIKNLEAELGVPLFEKDGRIYLNYAELKEGSKYIESLLNINCGYINLGFTFTMGQDLILRLIYEFKKTNKKILAFHSNDEIDLIFASKPQF